MWDEQAAFSPTPASVLGAGAKHATDSFTFAVTAGIVPALRRDPNAELTAQQRRNTKWRSARLIIAPTSARVVANDQQRGARGAGSDVIATSNASPHQHALYEWVLLTYAPAAAATVLRHPGRLAAVDDDAAAPLRAAAEALGDRAPELRIGGVLVQVGDLLGAPEDIPLAPAKATAPAPRQVQRPAHRQQLLSPPHSAVAVPPSHAAPARTTVAATAAHPPPQQVIAAAESACGAIPAHQLQPSLLAAAAAVPKVRPLTWPQDGVQVFPRRTLADIAAALALNA